MDLPPPIDAHITPDVPYNCIICARREEGQLTAHGRILRKAGTVTGVAIHGATFHVGDFALLRAEQGPARVVQIVGLYSGDPVWIRVQLLGRVSDLVDLLPDSELRDDVRLPEFLRSQDYTHAYTYLWFQFASAICSSRTRSRRCRSTKC